MRRVRLGGSRASGLRAGPSGLAGALDLATLRDEFPSLTLKAFTAVELDYFAELSGKGLDWVIEDLMRSGLAFVPGGGAEVLSDRVWKKLFRDKISPTRWLEDLSSGQIVGTYITTRP